MPRHAAERSRAGSRQRGRIIRPQAHHEKIVGGPGGGGWRFGWERAVEHVEEAHVLRVAEALVVVDSDGVHGV